MAPIYLPAMVADKKQAMLPAIMARKTIDAMSCRRSGAMAARPPNVIPIDPKFEKPHRAYVAITSERLCKETQRGVDLEIQLRNSV